MNNTILNVAHESCTGCGACINICPKHAISMGQDIDGYPYPVVNEAACIDCGICLRTCPVEHPAYENQSAPTCYAMWANDDIRKVSSSGGAFTLLAEKILAEGGVVAGAATSEDCYSVRHVLIDNVDDLPQIRGSKYVQSEAGDIYNQVKLALKEGKKALFTGCPCQVAAMKAVAGQDSANLYTVDIVCHGVPSQHLLNMFLKEQEKVYGAKATNISFRSKEVVPWNVSTYIEFNDGQKYIKKRNECWYMKAFLSLLTIRESCGHCKFATLPRQGDLSIADFWDIHRFNPDWDDRKGTSIILENNEKGTYLLDGIRKACKLCEPAPLEHAIKYNAQIKYSSLLSPKRERFLSLLRNEGFSFEKAVDFAMNDKYDVGYVGWWYGQNYGSAVTSYAMNRLLKAMGKTVLMLDFPCLTSVPPHPADTHTRRFANRFYDQSGLHLINDYSKFNRHCEAFLTGSDQLWNWWSNRDVGSYHFFLDFADKWHKKIAYSTSFGHEHVHYPEEMRLRVAFLLSRYDFISVREDSGIEVCRRDFSADAVQTLDPVFMCDKSEYDKAIEFSNIDVSQSYVLAYILNPTKEKKDIIQLTASKLGLPYKIILDGQGNFEELKKEMADENVLEGVGVEDWLKLFKHAAHIVTDSFHGFAFSMIFEKDMTIYPNAKRGMARFDSLGALAGIQDRFVYSLADAEKKELWGRSVDFSQMESRMADSRAFSFKWLEHALDSRKLPPSAKTLQLWKTIEHDGSIHKLKKSAEEQAEYASSIKNELSAVKSDMQELLAQKHMEYQEFLAQKHIEYLEEIARLNEEQRLLLQKVHTLEQRLEEKDRRNVLENILSVRNEGGYKIVRLFNGRLMRFKRKN